MAQTDHDLLARLNALRPSPVTLNTNPAIDIEVSRPKNAEDQLSERLKKLRNGQAATDDTGLVLANEVTSHNDTTSTDLASSIVQWQHDGHEQTIEELLAELEGNEQATLDPNSHADIQRLMQEAQSMLSPPEDQATHPDLQTNASEERPEGQNAADTNASGDVEAFNDEEEADEYVQKVLADLEIESKSSPPLREKSKIGEDESSESALPTAPTNIVELPAPPTYEDSELEARFAKLGLDLPSTPEGKPVSKKAAKSSSPKSKLPTFTDEEIDSWCVICNEDGEVRCLGCENDIYCQSCWQEGHGNKPGQETGHKAVQYVRKGGGLAVAD